MAINLDAVLDKLPDDRIEAANALLTAIVEAGARPGGATKEDMYQALGTYVAFAQANNLVVPPYSPTDWGREQLVVYFSGLMAGHRKELSDRKAKTSLQKGRDLFAMKSGKLFVYKFSETDVQEIQGHLNELRSLFASSEELTEEHRRRLQRRLEQLQTEVNKTMSDLDRFWGLVGDAGVAIRKFGDDSKNAALIVATVYKLTMLIWKAQLSAHGLPYEPTPLLPAPIIATPTEQTETI